MEPIARPLTPLSMGILVALAGGDLHGYALLQELEREALGGLVPGTGTLYAALQRMMEEGLIVESPDLPAPDEDQRRRYYRITREGRAAAAEESRRLAQLLETARQRKLYRGPKPAAEGGR
jgi:DNA-binding PadR family transcriptional regulator